MQRNISAPSVTNTAKIDVDGKNELANNTKINHCLYNMHETINKVNGEGKLIHKHTIMLRQQQWTS